MNILIVNTLYYPNSVGGAEKSVQALSEGLVNLGNNVTVLSTTNRSDYVDFVNGVKVYYINSRNIYWGFDNGEKRSWIKKLVWHTIDTFNPKFFKIIKNILKTEKPDIVHTNNLSGFSVVIWKIVKESNCKIVHTLRDYYLLCPNVTMFKNNCNCEYQCFSCKVFSKPKKNFSDLVDGLVGISSFIKDKHIQLGYFSNSINKSEVVGNDVGLIESNIRKIDKSNIAFGFIGQLNKSKGIEQVLSIFKELQSINNWTFLVAGNGETNYVKTLVEDYTNDKIKFLGRVDSNDFYNLIDILIVPSLWQEPFGRVVIEGIKHGKYVLGSNRGGISELLNENDLYEPDSKELEEKIIQILSNKEVPKQSNSFDIDVTSQYQKFYKKVLDE